MPEKIMLIDGNSIANRAYYGIPLLTNAEGIYTNAVYGFLNILFKLIEEEKPDYLAVAFDLHAPTFRHKKYEAYKGTRKGMPEELIGQMSLLKEVLSVMKIKLYEAEGYEADDILGTLSKKAQAAGYIPVVVSGDRDLLQLASSSLKIRIPKTKMGRTEIEDYYEKDVITKYGVTPTEFIDVKALMGDASDNIPGVPGIGEKTAVKIIQKYKNIETAIEHADEIKPKKASENLAEFKEQAVLSKFLATIVCDMDIELQLEEMGIQDMFTKKTYELFKRLEFKSMLGKFQLEKDCAVQNTLQEISLHKIDTKFDCSAFLESITKEMQTAYILFEENGILKGISFYNDEIGGVWLEPSQSLTEQKILEMTKHFFEEESFYKIAHDAKKDIRFLRKYNIELSHVKFDTALAGYILNPTRDTYEYDDIASEFLNEAVPSPEEVLGKGKGKLSVLDLEESKRIEFAVRQAQITFCAMPVMDKQITENGQNYLYYEIELPLLYVLADMEHYGMKINKKALEQYRDRLEESISTITKEIYDIVGEEFNLNSPKQLGVILFEKMGLKGGKKTKTGYSTAAEVLESLKYESPVIEKLLYYRQLAKLKSTYADGLLNIMDKETEKIYSTFNQTITATGRISSTEPNLQNIPIRLELGRELRKVFIPTSKEYKFLDADYSQIELRVLAHMSADKTLVSAFQNNQDIHRLTASQVFNIPFEKVTAKERSNAKAVNFGIVYGMSSFSLSQDLGITRKEAEEYMEGYFAKYPNIKKYMDKTIEDAVQKGYVSTMWGRRRSMPELQSKNFNQYSFGKRVAMNMPIQGSAADIIKMAMVKVHRSLKERNLKSRLILQVHDELLIEAHVDEMKQVGQLLKNDMEKAVELSVPLEVDVHEGDNWFETK